jgi:hypothetical protein
MEKRMLHSLSFAPKVVERLLRVFPTAQLDDRIEPDRFTAREVIAHLADYEQEILDRVRVANLQPGREVPFYEPDERCASHHFGTKEVFHEGEVYESRRNMLIEYLEGLQKEDWQKTFKLPDGQSVSIYDYVFKIVMHDLEHIEQLSHYLATEVATIS